MSIPEAWGARRGLRLWVREPAKLRRARLLEPLFGTTSAAARHRTPMHNVAARKASSIEDRDKHSKPKSRSALFVLAKPPPARSGPAAAWATTAGWALGAKEVLGHAHVLSPEGLLTPAEAYLRVSSAASPEPSTRTRWRSAVPEPAVTLAKDIRNLVRAKRAPLTAPPGILNQRKLAFVWQRHELFRGDGRRIANEANAPLVISAHAMQVREAAGWGVRRPGWTRLAERIGETRHLLEADLIACVSAEVALQLGEVGVRHDRILITPNGVDTRHFRPSPRRLEIRRSLGLDDYFLVGWAGSFRRFHGLEMAVEAVSSLQGRGRKVALVLYGDGQQRSELEAYARELGMQAVVFTGSIAHADLPHYLSALDAGLVLTGTPDSFHYSPVKLREYMACGVPVIAHAVGELAELLDDGTTAILVEPGSCSSLGAGVERLLQDPNLGAHIAEAGGRVARAEWSWSKQVERVLERLESLR